ncbi:hypothetical protein ABDK56_12005 [Sphingomonas sp. ASV193]|uniref:hypothetical protein n=1 Tax=Sphingomonas sp. ASV193 TaxID=3144405 RepID=UPI0032E90709
MATSGSETPERSAVYKLGCRLSEWVSDFAAHPYVQLGFIAFCVTWFALDWSENLLTAALSIIAITLTQMVLNRQKEREAEDRRRDIALHAKLDELLIASKRARSELAGLEEREESEIAEQRRIIEDRARQDCAERA